eukprot:354635-Chlamydomonas_euryale.AAC.4
MSSGVAKGRHGFVTCVCALQGGGTLGRSTRDAFPWPAARGLPLPASPFVLADARPLPPPHQPAVTTCSRYGQCNGGGGWQGGGGRGELEGSGYMPLGCHQYMLASPRADAS